MIFLTYFFGYVQSILLRSSRAFDIRRKLLNSGQMRKLFFLFFSLSLYNNNNGRIDLTAICVNRDFKPPHKQSSIVLCPS